MRFWDASAILPILFEEASSKAIIALYRADAELTVWYLTDVEIAASIARRSREGLSPEQAERIRIHWKRLAGRWSPVAAIERVRDRAIRLLQVHGLRAADSLQLASALVASDERPEHLPFVCLDDRLREAARREGFTVLPA
jgi:predicted nucleic acid-binding protein